MPELRALFTCTGLIERRAARLFDPLDPARITYSLEKVMRPLLLLYPQGASLISLACAMTLSCASPPLRRRGDGCPQIDKPLASQLTLSRRPGKKSIWPG